MLRSVSTRRLPKPLAVVLTVALALFWVLAVPPTSADAVTGGFVIDGAKHPLPAGTQTVSDPTGPNDTTVYSGGAKEDDPSSWQVNQSAGAPDSGDIADSYMATGYDGDFWLYFAFDRVASTGSIAYSVELNQAANTTNGFGVAIPDRSTGDLLFSMEQPGNGRFTVTDVRRWSGGGWTTYAIPSGAMDYAVSGDKNFVEFAFNLSEILQPVLGQIDCGELAFTNLWLRSRSAGSLSSQPKDFATGGVSLDTCAGLTIVKTDDSGADLAGATFRISPNPLPGGTGDLTETTDATGTIRLPEVSSGTYSVTEVAPPQGYLFEPGAEQTVELAPTQDRSLAFTNSLGNVAFTKTYQGAQPDRGATFTLEYLRGWDFSTATPTLSAAHAGHFGPITVVDNGSRDTDATLGGVHVGQVPSGEWRITETAAPTGWGLDPVAQTFVVGPHLAQQNGTFTAPSDGTFADPLLQVGLLVAKTESSAGSKARFGGVVFDLYLDDGDGVAQPGAADRLVGSQTTDAEGFAGWTGLNWQEQYWLKETVPTGYDTSLSPNPQLLTFAAPTKDGQVTTVAVDNPREEVTISLAKTDAYDGGRLTGGTFQLWRDVNRNGQVDPGVDVRVGGDKPLDQGHVSWTPQDSDTPWGYPYLVYEATAPAGYGLMSPNPIVVPTTVEDAGKTLSRTATDPRLPAGLKLLKADDYGQPVEGAGFELYLDDGDGTFGEDDRLVAGSARLSDPDGALVWQGLTWGESYWVVETSVPAGYQKMAPNPALVTVPRSAAGSTHQVTEPLVDPRVPSSLKVLKVDELDRATVLAGAELTLWLDKDRNGAVNSGDEVVAGPVVTGEDGTALFTDLLVWGHEYLLQETAAPAGYGFMSPNPLPIEVKRGQAGTTVERTVTDPRTPAGLQVRKTDAEQPELPVAGAGFRLWLDDGDGKLNPCGEVPSSCDIPVQDVRTTDENGRTEAWTGLTYGFTYLVEEVAPFPNGYAAMSPNPRSVSLTRADAGRTVVVDVSDPREPSDLVVTKLDATSKEKLDGAVFQLWEDTDRDGTPDTELAERVVDDGTAVFTDLVVWGHDYWLLETEAPEGYDLMSPNPVAVPNANTPGNVRDVVTMTVEDPRTPSDVTVYKADARTGEPVVGAQFELYLDSDGDGEVTEADGEPVDEAATARTGTFELEDLVWGLDYLLVETAVPAGYGFMSPNPLPFTLQTAGDTTFTIKDPRLTADLSVTKVAVGDHGQPLAGAQFALWQESNGLAGLQRDGEHADTDTGLTCTTGDEGTCTVTGVDWGPGAGAAYYWVETVAPDGYNLPTAEWAGPVRVTAQDATTQSGGENPFAAVVFADDVTGLTTTPLVNGEPGDLARIDDDDEIADRAELTGLSTPAGGDVDFFLYGPFEVDGEGALTEAVTCDADPVYASIDRPLSWDAESGRHLAFSHGQPATELEPGLYQWVASYSGDAKNRGATGGCPDPTEQVLVRAGDAPGVDKASDPDSGSVVQPGTQITYTVTASNTGDMPIPADQAVVVDTLPEWLHFEAMAPAVPAQPEPEVTENEDGTTTLRWRVGEVAGGASVTLAYLVSVYDDAPQGAVLENRAEFLDQRDTTTHVVPEGDLTVVKTADPANGTGVTVGEEITYTMTVTATGELNQRDVTVSDHVPGTDPYLTESVSTTYVPGSAACSGECSVTEPGDDGLVVWELGDLAAGTSRTVSFAVTIDQVNVAGTGTVEVGDVLNVAWVESFDTPPVESNQVEHPVTLVLGTKVTAPKPTAQPKPKPAVQVLGVKLPRTGAELGTALWLAGALLLLGGAMVLVARRRRGV